jgi:hypothetical protein
VTPKDISSSPSDHHIRHDKAVLKHPHQFEIVPHLWTRVTETMLEKEEGNSQCHHLHIIALFKNDFNQANHMILVIV